MQKHTYVEAIGDVIIRRRKGTRRLRLAVRGSVVTLSVPFGVSEREALSFLHTKRDWITSHREPVTNLSDGQRIGRTHTLRFVPSDSSAVTSRRRYNELIVSLPPAVNPCSAEAQAAARRISKRALRLEAESLLPKRLAAVAHPLPFTYQFAGVKLTKSRWGSCSHTNEITLSVYLVQLPYELIDYVIIHELCHTVEHNHSTAFWQLVAEYYPEYKELRKQLKTYQTDVM